MNKNNSTTFYLKPNKLQTFFGILSIVVFIILMLFIILQSGEEFKTISCQKNEQSTSCYFSGEFKPYFNSNKSDTSFTVNDVNKAHIYTSNGKNKTSYLYITDKHNKYYYAPAKITSDAAKIVNIKNSLNDFLQDEENTTFTHNYQDNNYGSNIFLSSVLVFYSIFFYILFITPIKKPITLKKTGDFIDISNLTYLINTQTKQRNNELRLSMESIEKTEVFTRLNWKYLSIHIKGKKTPIKIYGNFSKQQLEEAKRFLEAK